MMTQNADRKCEQIHMLCMDEMVSDNHLLRIIDKAIDWSFIYGLVEDKYSKDTGRPNPAQPIRKVVGSQGETMYLHMQ